MPARRRPRPGACFIAVYRCYVVVDVYIIVVAVVVINTLMCVCMYIYIYTHRERERDTHIYIERERYCLCCCFCCVFRPRPGAAARRPPCRTRRRSCRGTPGYSLQGGAVGGGCSGWG